ncbi:tripartite tricarboxylate transporter TctB family protein [Salipiger marinus]|jgi:putative tricarboxylic transport membrane protein|uniref:Tripartite tricarboxylate transporter TctB family protein n=1 Tax=Salipiger marinus TaxID=555512 RepID=A0A1G8TXQ6_9RHOB|nr:MULTISPECIES: tripartite tricarboxylate transporter TctB family protein [Salipiger]MEB3420643.1 tripartite tricarboxylate transporter TctB family protein [Salipiger manganoxidans]SDJ45500.1 Tripartite tricarboxylate transporter TctB family protein [Salipiger marinus]HBM57793.1 tripartite tricarboxylate transporter TctB family protein [Citreicella sp.]HBS99450.1 tripartite tricarboxylate transporter TctB family protein [Citreicella sp.]
MGERANLFRAGVLLPVFLLAVTTVYLAASFDIHTQFSGDGEMSPRSIPILAALLMYAALAVVLWTELREPSDSIALRDMARPALVVLATSAYIFLFRPLGYIPSTLAYSAVLLIIFRLETRRPHIFALYVIGVTATFYGLFAGIFGVRLPAMFEGLF